jgi:hypothetical protein
MKITEDRWRAGPRWTWLFCALLPCFSLSNFAATDKFDLLRTRTTVYTNVTVTSMTKTDVCIFHAGGICNIKVSELPPETIQMLNGSGVASGGDLISLEEEGSSAALSQTTDSVNQLNAQLLAELQKLRAVGGSFIIGFLVFCAVLYLFVCYCLHLICKKTGNEPGILIWLPVLQLFPMLRAAGMSPLWFLAWLVPGLSLIAQIVWSFNIAKARDKSAWMGFLLILPFTSIFALLYLAFSNGEAKEEGRIRPEPIVLECN